MTDRREYEDFTKELAATYDELIYEKPNAVDPFEEQHLLSAIASIATAIASLNLAALHKAKALGAMRLHK